MIEEFEHVHREGGLLASYKGRGRLHFVDGRQWECNFVVEHYVDLGVLLSCEENNEDLCIFNIKSTLFEGTGFDENLGEFTVRSFRNLHNTHSHIESSGTCTLNFSVDAIKIERTEHEVAVQARYGITNFAYYPTDWLPATGDKGTIGKLGLNLNTELGSLAVDIERQANYENVKKYISKYHAIRVTCEAVVHLDSGEFSESIDGVIGGLCQVMSVARGTRIIWVYRKLLDAANRPCKIYHVSGRPGHYFSVSLFDDGNCHSRDVKRFLEGAYPIFRQKHAAFELGNNLIDSYLSAKAAVDLLERRGLKLAVSLEILKHLHLKQDDCDVAELVIKDKHFRKIGTQLRVALREELNKHKEKYEISDIQIDEMCGKLNEMNRTSFRPILKSTFDAVGFYPSDAELDLFIKQRNSLTHTGHFYKFKQEDRDIIYFLEEGTKADDFPVDSLGTEPPGYYFMLNLVDRLFLKFFKYAGPYLNTKVNLQAVRVGNHDVLE